MESLVCLLLLLLLREVLRAECFDDFPERSEEDVDFKRLENEFAVGNVTAPFAANANATAAAVAESSEDATVPTAENLVTARKPSANNKSDEFRPSVHLGEIEEFALRRRPSNPFNSVKPVKFENFINFEPAVEAQSRGKQNPKLQPSRALEDIDARHKAHPPQRESFGGTAKIQTHSSNSGRVTFPHSAPSHPSGSPVDFDGRGFGSYSVESPYFTPDENAVERYPSIHEKPSKLLQGETNFVTPYAEILGYREYLTKPPSFEGGGQPEVVGRPVEFHASSFGRPQKFPYKFYREPVELPDGDIGYIEEEPARPLAILPKDRKVSPWKRIVHFIGTLLPLGLLLASLTPTIVQIGNTTQPNIVLSKLRDIDLPVQHKRGRSELDPVMCEERSACEIILAGSKPKSHLLQNVLWNFVTRTTEEAARNNDLQEVFNAIKNKNCSAIEC